MIRNIFNNSVFISKINTSKITNGSTFHKEVHEYLNQFSSYIDPHSQGKTLTTVIEPFGFIHLPDSEKLLSQVFQQSIIAGEELGFKKKWPNIRRCWVNKSFQNSRQASHYHDIPNIDLVCIVYLDAPVGSSDLIFINSSEVLKFDYEFPTNIKEPIKVEEGMIVFHPKRLTHAVGIHNSSQPRTCFIFELEYF